MGYTHRWFREKEIDSIIYQAIVTDFKSLLLPLTSAGVLLVDGEGANNPVINHEMVWFNGKRNCGHLKINPFSNPWPSSNAGGIALSREVSKKICFAGLTLESRCCDGNCSGEAFHFPRVLEQTRWLPIEYKNKYRQLCETGFRPYDLAVTAFLVVAKHHLKDKLLVTSDGNDNHWFDAKLLSQMELGYGLRFSLDK